MGDITTTYYPCPKCGKEVEEYDAPSSLMFGASCTCGWSDDRDYYETGEHEIALLSKKEAEEQEFCTSCRYNVVALAKSLNFNKYFKELEKLEKERNKENEHSTRSR